MDELYIHFKENEVLMYGIFYERSRVLSDLLKQRKESRTVFKGHSIKMVENGFQ